MLSIARWLSFPLCTGHQLWVTNPVEVNENGSLVPPVEGSPSFYAATLGCSGPAFASYGCMGTVHVFHEGIVPGGTYHIEFLSEFCSPDSSEDFSPSLEITNSELGDVVGLVTTPYHSAPNQKQEFTDFFAILRRFANVPDAMIKARADLEPGCLDLVINISDILSAIAGFVGLQYAFAPTASDPCASTCFNPLP